MLMCGSVLLPYLVSFYRMARWPIALITDVAAVPTQATGYYELARRSGLLDPDNAREQMATERPAAERVELLMSITQCSAGRWRVHAGTLPLPIVSPVLAELRARDQAGLCADNLQFLSWLHLKPCIRIHADSFENNRLTDVVRTILSPHIHLFYFRDH